MGTTQPSHLNVGFVQNLLLEVVYKGDLFITVPRQLALHLNGDPKFVCLSFSHTPPLFPFPPLACTDPLSQAQASFCFSLVIRLILAKGKFKR